MLDKWEVGFEGSKLFKGSVDVTSLVISVDDKRGSSRRPRFEPCMDVREIDSTRKSNQSCHSKWGVVVMKSVCQKTRERRVWKRWNLKSSYINDSVVSADTCLLTTTPHLMAIFGLWARLILSTSFCYHWYQCRLSTKQADWCISATLQVFQFRGWFEYTLTMLQTGLLL